MTQLILPSAGLHCKGFPQVGAALLGGIRFLAARPGETGSRWQQARPARPALAALADPPPPQRTPPPRPQPRLKALAGFKYLKHVELSYNTLNASVADVGKIVVQMPALEVQAGRGWRGGVVVLGGRAWRQGWRAGGVGWRTDLRGMAGAQQARQTAPLRPPPPVHCPKALTLRGTGLQGSLTCDLVGDKAHGMRCAPRAASS
jgi:hypothetical protein